MIIEFVHVSLNYLPYSQLVFSPAILVYPVSSSYFTHLLYCLADSLLFIVKSSVIQHWDILFYSYHNTKKNIHHEQISKPFLGQHVCGLFDKQWCRARITSIIRDDTQQGILSLSCSIVHTYLK